MADEIRTEKEEVRRKTLEDLNIFVQNKLKNHSKFNF